MLARFTYLEPSWLVNSGPLVFGWFVFLTMTLGNAFRQWITGILDRWLFKKG